MDEIKLALITAAVGIIIAVGGFIASYFKLRQQNTALNALKAAIEQGGGIFYILCPNCGHKIYLHNAEIKRED